MKSVLMFTMEACPFCKEASTWMEELKEENVKYFNIDIKKIDERRQPDIANKYDYYYVPTYYVDGEKVHEGAATKEIVRKILEKACE
ncbi:glutaredoxin domain-containing protein [Anaerosolibacter sp.]|jgi:glutaredoxin|uniref:glutaredoxin domain-containing protein n=1 Tax=Anaerosolibacter sp. TaxID=1872527 RepID=UPI00261ED008|nr:thioredoxin family protein [Anaerosolibacter sp.]MDF2547621.1 glutaredoxin [Anaerosolibacter sp.]